MSAVTEEKNKKGAEVLQGIANITGKPGLYRILKPGRAGVIIESLDDDRKKSIASATAKVSVLKDVSVYVENQENESVPLSDVFLKIRELHGEAIELDVKKASDKDLVEFLAAVLPDYNRSRVYISDIRKIISWYTILSRFVPELFEEAEPLPSEDAAPVETAAVGTPEKATKGKKAKSE